MADDPKPNPPPNPPAPPDPRVDVAPRKLERDNTPETQKVVEPRHVPYQRDDEPERYDKK